MSALLHLGQSTLYSTDGCLARPWTVTCSAIDLNLSGSGLTSCVLVVKTLASRLNWDQSSSLQHWPWWSEVIKIQHLSQFYFKASLSSHEMFVPARLNSAQKATVHPYQRLHHETNCYKAHTACSGAYSSLTLICLSCNCALALLASTPKGSVTCSCVWPPAEANNWSPWISMCVPFRGLALVLLITAMILCTGRPSKLIAQDKLPAGRSKLDDTYKGWRMNFETLIPWLNAALLAVCPPASHVVTGTQ